MPNAQTVLSQFSDSLSELAAGARGILADVRTADGRQMSGILWKPNAVVVSEQTLPEEFEYQVRIADAVVNARLAGRDEGTNVAVLKLENDLPAALPSAAVPRIGALVLALGMGTNGVAARLAMVRSVAGPWQSLAGGAIDRRITLDTRLGATEEGGPVLAADGSIFGMSTRGAGRQSLVIPASTIERITTLLLEKGSIERGWLGISLRPVALPETLRPDASQRVGLMVMEIVADGPAAKAGVLAGDILLTVDGSPTTRPLHVARKLGAESVGKTIEVALARAGATLTCHPAVEARKA